MKTVTVDASRKYDVIIGKNLLKDANKYILKNTECESVVIVTDDNVEKLYLSQLIGVLKKSFLNVYSFVIPNGESSKNADNYIKLLNFCAENKITRTDAIIALGGGVVGDLTGFVAATYLRGIKFVQIPTTLLAQVDSSVGGKTAIDLDCGKNLAGAFYQPEAVLCDLDTLNTLKDNVFTDGCAEVIKYAVLGNEELFCHLMERGKNFDREYVVYECVKMKRDIVAEDEFDTGKRMLLNLGHTVGHGVEAASGYTISHGSAVAIGMATVARVSYKNCICGIECADKIERILKTFNLPTECTFDEDTLYKIMLSDKKRAGKTLNIIVPEKIGSCKILKMDVTNLKDFIKAGL